ncbi:hypothetical protein [Herbiconiux daphne]|uniref:Uncharacterized protein n=1 Tax=Herbiconiux daphne TaxID=2970914 RepID=A0ABT2HB49_9MICO|nr:hypothetical protein [Herbiconiux daphne]MCS5737081.1 hypothetical protein [Herbiconiux daphne]
MFVESDYLRCRLTLTHEEAEAMARFLNARKFGGEMKANDHVVVDTVLANLVEHNKQIADRIARIGTTGNVIRAGIQKQADAEFNQLKSKDLTNVGELADKLIESGILGNN